MTNTKFNKKAELESLGIANLVSGVLGGIPVTAALARTGLNIKSGCTHRYSSLISSVLMFSIAFFFMNYFSFIPMPVIAAQVCIVAVRLVNFAEIEHLYNHDKKNFYLFVIIVIISVVRDSIQAVLFGMLIYQIMFCKQLTNPWTEIIKAKNMSNSSNMIRGTNDSHVFSRKSSVISVEGCNKKLMRNSISNGRNIEEFLNNNCGSFSPQKKRLSNVCCISENTKECETNKLKIIQENVKDKDQADKLDIIKNENKLQDGNEENNHNHLYHLKRHSNVEDNQRNNNIENKNNLNDNVIDYFNNADNDGDISNQGNLNLNNLISTFEDVNDYNFFDIPKQEGNFIVYRIVGILNFMNVETHIDNINKLNLDPHSKIIISLRYVHLIDNEAVHSLENIIKTVSEKKENKFEEKGIKILIGGITKNKLNLIRKSEFIQKLLMKNAILLAN